MKHIEPSGRVLVFIDIDIDIADLAGRIRAIQVNDDIDIDIDIADRAGRNIDIDIDIVWADRPYFTAIQVNVEQIRSIHEFKVKISYCNSSMCWDWY